MKNKLLRQVVRMSKITFYGLCIQMILAGLLLAKSSDAQQKKLEEINISLNVKNITLGQVLLEIGEKSDFNIVYNDYDIRSERIINLHVKNKSLGFLLKQLSKDYDLHFRRVDDNIYVGKKELGETHAVETSMLPNQGNAVSGKVTSSEDNEGLPGVNVIVKGTSQGTVTDVNGDYKIEVPDLNAVLVYSSVGFNTQEIQVGERSVIDVVMTPDIHALGEVVVTALGIKREERSLGYAVSETDGAELAQASTTNPVSALQGKIAGVQINTTAGGTFGGTRITIRGNSTLGGNTQPIFVVDGVVLDNETSGVSGTDWGNQLKDLNPDDFESVSVLKGAAATALYGSRALNGVVLITTKSGQHKQGLGVSFKQTSGVRYVYASPGFQNEYGYGPVAGMFSNDVDNGRPDKDKHDNQQFAFYELVDGQYVPSLQHNMSEENAASWGPKFEGQDYIDYDGSMAKWVAQPNNYKDMFELGTINNTNVAIEGASERNSFRVSYTNYSDNGVEPMNDFLKNSFSIKGSQDLIKDVVKVEASVQYTRSLAKNPPSGILQTAWFHDGFPRSYDVNKWRNNYKDIDGGVPFPTGSDKYMYTKKSQSWFDIYERDIERKEGSLLAQTALEFNIADGLHAKIEGNINQFTYENETKTAATSMDRLSNAYYYLEHGEKFQSTLSASLFYKKQLSDAFNLDVLLGGQLWNTRSTSSGAHTDRGFKVRDFYNIGNSYNSPIFTGGIGFNKDINSVYSYVNLDYKSTFYLSLTGRNDWSSALAYPDGGGNTSYFYPSASLAWVLNQSINLPESIFAKLRVSYAYVGNDTDPYKLSSGFVIQDFNAEPNMKLYKYKNSVAVSPNLRPESKRSFETGLDLRFLNGRAGLDFSFYRDNTIDQILSLNVPSESGISQQLINAGNLQNQGVELMLHGTPVKSNDFSWDLGMTFTHNRDKIIEMYPGIEEVILFGNPSDANAGTATVAYAGGDYGMLATREGYTFYDGANTANHGEPVLFQRNNWTIAYPNGRNNMDSLVIMGNMQPDWYGSFTTSLRYKNFNLYALFDMSFGGDIYSHTYRYGLHQGVIESSLPNRDAEHGGITWVSKGFGQNYYGKTYYDGYIPDGVFPDGTVVTFKDDNGVTTSYDVGGMTYQEAYDQDMVEPTHWSGYIYRWTSASTGGPQMAIFESNWIMFRELTISYDFPQQALKNIFLQNVRLSLTARDIGFIHNSLPDNINPIISNNAAGNALQMGFAPYIRSLTFTLNCNF